MLLLAGTMTRPASADEFGTVDFKSFFKKNYANPPYHHRLPPLTLQTIDGHFEPRAGLIFSPTHPETPL